MKPLVLILFLIFVLQTDTLKVDTVRCDTQILIQYRKTVEIEKSIDHDLNQLDSIIAILKKDTIK